MANAVPHILSLHMEVCVIWVDSTFHGLVSELACHVPRRMQYGCPRRQMNLQPHNMNLQPHNIHARQGKEGYTSDLR